MRKSTLDKYLALGEFKIFPHYVGDSVNINNTRGIITKINVQVCQGENGSVFNRDGAIYIQSLCNYEWDVWIRGNEHKMYNEDYQIKIARIVLVETISELFNHDNWPKIKI